jgi:hypothetical protein
MMAGKARFRMVLTMNRPPAGQVKKASNRLDRSE